MKKRLVIFSASMVNSHCGICDVESQCGYEYKPCDCCNYRKYKPKRDGSQVALAVYLETIVSQQYK